VAAYSEMFVRAVAGARRVIARDGENDGRAMVTPVRLAKCITGGGVTQVDGAIVGVKRRREEEDGRDVVVVLYRAARRV